MLFLFVFLQRERERESACMCVCVLIAVDRTRADTFYCLMYTVQRKCSEDLEVVVVSP